MTRLAKGRTTHLSPEEIATEMLRQFDGSGGAPTIRGLAAALSCTPKAIYHYFATRADLEQAAVDLVWNEAADDIIGQLEANPALAEDPIEFLILSAVASRRAFARHWRISFHLGAPPKPNERLSGALAIIGSVFEQLGLADEEQIGLALYGYVNFSLGSIVLDASRRASEATDGAPAFSSAGHRPDDAPAIREETSEVIDRVITETRADRDIDEQLFIASLRTLLRGFQTISSNP